MKTRTFALLLLVGGCSSESVEETEFCHVLAEAECGAVKEHCAVADEGACIIHREFDCQVTTRKLQTMSKGFNEVGAGACVQKVRTVYAKATISAAELREVDRACLNIYWGQQAAGEACMFDRECKGTNTCKDKVCKSSAPSVGCGGMGPCPQGMVCEGFSQALGTPICISLPAAGMPCTRQFRCAESARCDQQTCVERTPVGGECFKDDECQLPSAFCDPGTLLCATGFAVTPQSPFCEPFKRDRPGDAAPRPDVTPRGDGREAAVDVAVEAAGDAPADAPVDAAEDVADAGPDRPD